MPKVRPEDITWQELIDADLANPNNPYVKGYISNGASPIAAAINYNWSKMESWINQEVIRRNKVPKSPRTFRRNVKL